MEKSMYGFAERIKSLRDKAGLTQSELARKLTISRASVNAWEMGLSTPSVPYIVELSKLFHVTTDYLLGLNDTAILKTDTLTKKQLCAIMNVIDCFNNGNL